MREQGLPHGSGAGASAQGTTDPAALQPSKFCWRLLSDHRDLVSGCLNTTEFKATAASITLKSNSSWRKETRSEVNSAHPLGSRPEHRAEAQANDSRTDNVPFSLAKATATPHQPEPQHAHRLWLHQQQLLRINPSCSEVCDFTFNEPN